MVEEHDFTYCPKCGNSFEKKWANLLVCGRCDLHYYINPRPTNAIILENEKHEILFIKRKYPPKKGFLDLPGGFVDINESVEESMTREIREELGIIMKKFSYLGSYLARYPFKGINYYTICMVYTAPFDSKKITQKVVEEGALIWVKKEKLDFGKLAFAGLKDALKDYLAAA